jgi:hypothetical protein
MTTRFTLFEFAVETAGFASALGDFATAQTQQAQSAAVAGVVSSVSSIAARASQSTRYDSAGASYGFGKAAASFGAGAFAFSASKASSSYSQWQAGTKTYEEFERDLGDAVANFGSLLGGLAGMAWAVAKNHPAVRAASAAGFAAQALGLGMKHEAFRNAAGAVAAEYGALADRFRDAGAAFEAEAGRALFEPSFGPGEPWPEEEGDLADAVSEFFNDARNWTPARDPFALDLDGDGVETVGAMGASTVRFDHDNDGILQGTGWLRGDDGWLALDRDGDGLITSGAELFGVDTPLATGTWDTVLLANAQRTIFRDGFSAIAPLDTNRDGRIDAADGAVAGWSIARDVNGNGTIEAGETRLATITDLRVWRDLNANGRTDAGELMTLAQANVASINVTRAWQGSTALGNGNEVVATGSYVRADTGTTRATAALNLGVHSFYRSFEEPQTVSSGAQSLPTLNGSGAVADLQVAASQSGALAGLLASYSVQTTRAAQQSMLDALIGEWAATSSMDSGREQGVDRQVIIEYHVWGLTTTILALMGTELNNATAAGQLPIGWGQFELVQKPQWREWVRRMEVIEKFDGSTLVYLDALQVQTQTQPRTPGLDPQTQQLAVVTATWRQVVVTRISRKTRWRAHGALATRVRTNVWQPRLRCRRTLVSARIAHFLKAAQTVHDNASLYQHHAN